MIRKLSKTFYEQLTNPLQNVQVISLSCAMGVYIAFSPFICLHTALVFFLSWILMLNMPLVFTVSTLINNPWTMVPVYALDHIFGDCVIKFFGYRPEMLDPLWVAQLNNYLRIYIQLPNFSLSSFFIGGNVLGIIISIIVYSVLKIILKRRVADNLTGH